MRAELYWVGGTMPGRLAIAPRPRGGDWLEDEVRAWRAAGVNVVVSALTPNELLELDLEREEALVRGAEIDFRSIPIPDRGLPASRAAVLEMAEALRADLEQGRNVLVHCRQGIGRSSMIAASIMVTCGSDPAEALTRIETVRGRPVPDTPEQRTWILSLRASPSHHGHRTRRT